MLDIGEPEKTKEIINRIVKNILVQEMKDEDISTSELYNFAGDVAKTLSDNVIEDQILPKSILK